MTTIPDRAGDSPARSGSPAGLPETRSAGSPAGLPETRSAGSTAAGSTAAGATGGSLGGTVRSTVLPSGLRVLTESIPAMRSVSIGVWVAVGSRDETAELSGVSHFLEHLLFKGTHRRSALDISAEIEAVGG